MTTQLKEIKSDEQDLIEKFRTVLRAFEIANPNKLISKCTFVRTEDGTIQYDIVFKAVEPAA